DPFDTIGEIGDVGAHWDEVLPGPKPVVVPLSIAELALDLEHAAALMEPHQEVPPGVGLPVDVDRELVADPLATRDGRTEHPVQSEHPRLPRCAPLVDERRIEAVDFSRSEDQPLPLRDSRVALRVGSERPSPWSARSPAPPDRRRPVAPSDIVLRADSPDLIESPGAEEVRVG